MHPANRLTGGWDQNFFQLNRSFGDKFWPPVRRVGEVRGSRHLMDTSPSVETHGKAVA